MFILFVVACLQVVHAIMRVTPWARISEEVLRKAIATVHSACLGPNWGNSGSNAPVV